MEIYLIRHGASYECTPDQYDEDKGMTNPELTPKGREQAERLAVRLEKLGFDKIYSSDLKSAVQTTEIVNHALNTEVEFLAGFREIHMGEIYKKSWGEYPELFAKWSLFQEDIPYPGGENGADVWERCKKELDRITASDYGRIAIVTHQGTIEIMVCGMLNIPQEGRYCFGESLMHASVSVVQYMNKKYFLHTFNDYSHLNIEGMV
ncbi:MAG TPA: histidine phosphatase family protein [Clostridiales bacterium]|nr:histidine phosphatase family protein [Clostridiales bacterium]